MQKYRTCAILYISPWQTIDAKCEEDFWNGDSQTFIKNTQVRHEEMDFLFKIHKQYSDRTVFECK